MTAAPAQASQTNAYLRTRVLTANPEELRLMLLDGAIRFLNQGIDGLRQKNYEQSYNGISQSRAIVVELLTSIRGEHAPELAERMHALYSFLYSELVEASFQRDVPRLSKVLELLEFERETWSMALDKLRTERAGQGTAPATQGAALTLRG